jgi:hypothetical protein
MINQNQTQPGAVAHAYHPSYLGGGDQEDCSSRPTCAKKAHMTTPSQSIKAECGRAPVIPAMQEV